MQCAGFVVQILPDLVGLFDALHADGRAIIGPTVRGDAIILAELDEPAALPYGWRADVAAGRYRLRHDGEPRAFTHTSSPQSWKQVVHPPRERLLSADRTDDGFTVDAEAPEPRRIALLGVRPCDLRAIGVLDRVLGDGGRYAGRRREMFIVAVNCTEPGDACFCVSAGGGPRAGAGYDLALTERPDGTYLATAGTALGATLLDRLPGIPATAAEVSAGDEAVDGAASRMGRALPPGDLRSLLTERRDSPHWEDVGARCLTCANCTMVCPTCFCTSVTDTTHVTGDHAERWQTWDSCFDLNFSHIHGGPVRTSRDSRYRQWLTHKFSAWHDQFGEAGCVGCGRCIAWCPVGIDITAELQAFNAEGTT
jgi:ferredoxin